MMVLPRRSWPVVIAVFAAALAVYWTSAIALGRTETPDDAYFNLLAEAFLRGQLHLVSPPANHDLTLVGGRWYVPFPPLPALLMLPLVALAGQEGINTVLFGTVVGAANVTLVFALLEALTRHGWSKLGRSRNLWLTALFGVGSVHWYMATQGTVWFLGQICATGFVLAAVWAAVATGSPLFAGALLACAMLGRPHLVLSFPLLLGIRAQQLACRPGGRTVQSLARWGAVAAALMAGAMGLLLWYNAARFGSPLNFGYATQNVATELASDLETYGQFSLHYVPRNLRVMLLAGPVWDEGRRQLLPTIDGMSMLLTTPALVYLMQARRPVLLVVGACVAVGLLLIPLVTYYNTGWWQFGYRFSLDVMAPILVLLALAVGPRVGVPMRLLILVGVVVNAWGTWWFQNPRFF